MVEPVIRWRRTNILPVTLHSCRLYPVLLLLLRMEPLTLVHLLSLPLGTFNWRPHSLRILLTLLTSPSFTLCISIKLPLGYRYKLWTAPTLNLWNTCRTWVLHPSLNLSAPISRSTLTPLTPRNRRPDRHRPIRRPNTCLVLPIPRVNGRDPLTLSVP